MTTESDIANSACARSRYYKIISLKVNVATKCDWTSCRVDYMLLKLIRPWFWLFANKKCQPTSRWVASGRSRAKTHHTKSATAWRMTIPYVSKPATCSMVLWPNYAFIQVSLSNIAALHDHDIMKMKRRTGLVRDCLLFNHCIPYFSR